MNPAQIQLACVVLTKIIFIITPFLAVFREEWWYIVPKTVGILIGYLFFVCLLNLTCFRHYLSRPWLEMAWVCTIMVTNISVYKWMVRTD